MKMAIDFDNVIVDSHAVNITRINKLFNLKLIAGDVTTTFYTDLVNKPRSEESQLLQTLNQQLSIKQRPPIDGVSAVTQMLFSEGHKLNIISARPEDETELVSTYCKELNIPFENIYCVDALYEGHDKKSKLCMELGLEMLVDDQLAYLESCLDMLALLFNRPWNKHLDTPKHVHRVQSWFELKEVIDVHIAA
jgi:uncharacterized HAD superfamily protein